MIDEKIKHPMVRDARFIRREYRRALLPVMISVLGGTVNTLIDSIFVTRRLDATALAAVSLNMPIFLVLCMIGCTFASGAFVAASHALGKNNSKRASLYYHTAILYMTVFGIISLIVGIFFSEQIAEFLCEDTKILEMVTDYCRITLIGGLLYLLAYMPSYFLQLAGDSKGMTVMMVIMIVTDVIFDLMFLYLLNLGVAGAALASLLSMALASVYGFIKLQKPDGIFRFSFRLLSNYGIGSILRFGSVQAVGNLMDAIRMLLLNWIIYKASGTEGLAVWAVINSMLEISLCIIAGVPRTAEPLLGIYAGGHDNSGIRMIVRYEFMTGILFATVYSCVLIVCHSVIGSFFKIEQSLLIPFVCLGVSLILEVNCSILGSYYNVTKRTILSNLIMVMRTVAFAVPIAWVLLATSSMIWMFLPLSMVAVLIVIYIIAGIISARTKKTEHELSGVLLIDDYLERTKKVKSISIESSDEKICEASEYLTEFCIEQNMDMKTARKLGLAFEEIMTVMAKKSLRHDNDPVDVRIYSIDDQIGISIMCSGKHYDLFAEAENSDDEFNIGVQMIQKLTKKCSYIYTLGINVLSVEV